VGEPDGGSFHRQKIASRTLVFGSMFGEDKMFAGEGQKAAPDREPEGKGKGDAPTKSPKKKFATKIKGNDLTPAGGPKGRLDRRGFRGNRSGKKKQLNGKVNHRRQFAVRQHGGTFARQGTSGPGKAWTTLKGGGPRRLQNSDKGNGFALKSVEPRKGGNQQGEGGTEDFFSGGGGRGQKGTAFKRISGSRGKKRKKSAKRQQKRKKK